MKLDYDVTQLSKAAKFLWKKNPIYRVRGDTIADVKESILRDLKRYAKEVKSKIKNGDDWRFLSTGGYTILIFQDDQDHLLTAVILVDASVSEDDHDFMTIDISK